MSMAGPSTAALQTSHTTKRLSTHARAPVASGKPGPGPSGGLTGSGGAGTGGAGVGLGKEVLNPGELCGFVDTLLSQLETRFDEMSEQVTGRMNEMSARIDNLENTIQDLMTSDIDVPPPQQDGSTPLGVAR
ncbi:heat shock factor binding protein 1-domain-containing protein [Dioszegia hungarica]|uniref:Heat shock factor binding protein 1-domain-containing protein n=1 Tax=Dioszegia hungarica TaxID=4972 RepID=A0AA38H9I8_9TREE|nr:heat shock factor binding protein 1-domain-containing protein [Dioszegia hungarica]KAI9635141.1 heat shock factor binding protein 1-domain-containing protein [Dioszegia hungarica]